MTKKEHYVNGHWRKNKNGTKSWVKSHWKKNPEREKKQKDIENFFIETKFSEHDRINKQANEINNWVKENNYELKIVHKEPDLRIDIFTKYKRANIRLFPIGESVDIILYRYKDAPISEKSYRDIGLESAKNYIKNYLNYKMINYG